MTCLARLKPPAKLGCALRRWTTFAARSAPPIGVVRAAVSDWDTSLPDVAVEVHGILTAIVKVLRVGCVAGLETNPEKPQQGD